MAMRYDFKDFFEYMRIMRIANNDHSLSIARYVQQYYNGKFSIDDSESWGWIDFDSEDDYNWFLLYWA